MTRATFWPPLTQLATQNCTPAIPITAVTSVTNRSNISNSTDNNIDCRYTYSNNRYLKKKTPPGWQHCIFVTTAFAGAVTDESSPRPARSSRGQSEPLSSAYNTFLYIIPCHFDDTIFDTAVTPDRVGTVRKFGPEPLQRTAPNR